MLTSDNFLFGNLLIHTRFPLTSLAVRLKCKFLDGMVRVRLALNLLQTNSWPRPRYWFIHGSQSVKVWKSKEMDLVFLPSWKKWPNGIWHTQGSVLMFIWWRHQMETFSALLVLYEWNPPVTGRFPSQRPVTRSFDVFLMCTGTHDRANSRNAGGLRHNAAHCDVTVIWVAIGAWISNYIHVKQ